MMNTTTLKEIKKNGYIQGVIQKDYHKWKNIDIWNFQTS
jgi:hypothetical protein